MEKGERNGKKKKKRFVERRLTLRDDRMQLNARSVARRFGSPTRIRDGTSAA
jgi:hypothetical protein